MAENSFIVFADHEKRASELAGHIGANPHAEVLEVIRELSELGRAVAEQDPDAIFADLGDRPAEVLEALQKLPVPRPVLVVSGSQADNRLLLAAVRLGVRDYLPSDFERSSLDTLLDGLAGESRSETTQEAASVTAIMGAKGGVGATFLACQLSAAFQRDGRCAALVDLSLPVGDAAVHLDLQPNFTLADVATEGERVDATSLRAILQSHDSGLRLLAAPAAIEEAQRIEAQHIDHVLTLLRGEFERIVIDVPRAWSDVSTVALDRADLVLLVTTPEVPALYQARQHLGLLRRLGFESKLRIVANGCRRGQSISDEDYASFLGQTPDLSLPDDETVQIAVSQGKLLHEVTRRGSLAKALDELPLAVDTWSDRAPPPRESKSWIHRLWGRRANGTH